MEESKSVFDELNCIDVSSKTEKKNNLTYLSWAWAWAELKKKYPNATSTIYENKDGWNYFTDGKTCWVKCGVTINGIEHIETLAVMDFRNKSVPFANVTSVDVGKSIQRCITKAIARHGLGLYIYAGEDLPEGDSDEQKETQAPVQMNQRQTISENPAVDKQKAKLADIVQKYGESLQGQPLALAKTVLNTEHTSLNDVNSMIERCVSYLGKKGIQVA